MNRYLSIVLILFSFQAHAQGIIFTIGGTGISGHSGDSGPALTANIATPVKGRFDLAGNYYFAEWDSNRVRRIDPAGIITTIAGTGVPGFNGNDIVATSATLSKPADIIADSVGNLFIADQYNFRIRRIDAATGIITTIAGTGQSTSTGDGGPAVSATLQWPAALAFSRAGELHICTGTKIRKIDNAGVISTVLTGAGNMRAISFDPSGCMYYAEGNYIKMIDSTGGGPHLIGGTGSTAFTVDSGLAINAGMDPVDLAVDKFRSVFFADKINGRIRWIDSLGTITTVAGGGSTLGDWGPATNANIKPGGLAIDTCGFMYIADANFRIRKTIFPYCHFLVVSVNDVQPLSFSLSPNPARSVVSITSNSRLREVNVCDAVGKVVVRERCNSEKVSVNVEGLPAGVYFVGVLDERGASRVEKMVKQ